MLFGQPFWLILADLKHWVSCVLKILQYESLAGLVEIMNHLNMILYLEMKLGVTKNHSLVSKMRILISCKQRRRANQISLDCWLIASSFWIFFSWSNCWPSDLSPALQHNAKFSFDPRFNSSEVGEYGD